MFEIILAIIYAIICIPFAFIGKGYYRGAFLVNWITCIAFTPLLGVFVNKYTH